MKPHTQKFLQKRRFYMALPILVLPFITMIFWALGGGKGAAVQAQEVHTGLNMELPGAHFNKEDELWDKFSLYEQAKRDSIKYEEARRNDPYYVVSTIAVASQDTIKPKTGNLNTSLGTKDRLAEMNKDEALINQKLEQLTRQISDPQEAERRESVHEQPTQRTVIHDPEMTSDVDRLEKMMEAMSSGNANDPEMEQIGDVLDKILEIQHPERVNDKIREESLSHKQQVFPVQVVTEDDNITSIETQPTIAQTDTVQNQVYPVATYTNSFYGLDGDESSNPETSNAIEAVIHETQTVVAGSTIRMRLLSDVYINGELVEKDQFIYGKCAINGDRLTVSINSVRDENSLLPVALSVYDLDGMEGISIPGAIARDAAKQAGSQSIQDVELYSMNNSLGVQAATAGIEAAKGLFTKKVKLIKVTVKAGYNILLKDNNQKNI